MTLELSPRLLEILCCPITRRPLRRLDAATLLRLNRAIGDGEIRNHGGESLTEPLDAALVTVDGDLVYPLQQGIPILHEETCIHWAAFKDA